MTTLKKQSREESGFNTEPGPIVLKELDVRPAEPEEMELVRELLDKEHYLGAGRDVGRTLVQVVHHRGQRVALLTWGPAAMRLIERDDWISWTPQQFPSATTRPARPWP